MRKKGSLTPPSHHTKNNYRRWIIDFNKEFKSVKLLDKNIGENFHNLEAGKDFFKHKHMKLTKKIFN